jgi:2,4-dienoyl-CoA reductase-like NADH-dependent reductase (Old Yellow Enzyme family)
MAERLDPLDFIHGPALNNRCMPAPPTNPQNQVDGHMAEEPLSWLTGRATGRFGWVMTRAAQVRCIGPGFRGHMGVFSDDHLPSWTIAKEEMAAAVA